MFDGVQLKFVASAAASTYAATDEIWLRGDNVTTGAGGDILVGGAAVRVDTNSSTFNTLFRFGWQPGNSLSAEQGCVLVGFNWTTAAGSKYDLELFGSYLDSTLQTILTADSLVTGSILRDSTQAVEGTTLESSVFYGTVGLSVNGAATANNILISDTTSTSSFLGTTAPS